jgi:hypothetical protein
VASLPNLYCLRIAILDLKTKEKLHKFSLEMLRLTEKFFIHSFLVQLFPRGKIASL